jgi:hypothetical protein
MFYKHYTNFFLHFFIKKIQYFFFDTKKKFNIKYIEQEQFGYVEQEQFTG